MESQNRLPAKLRIKGLPPGKVLSDFVTEVRGTKWPTPTADNLHFFKLPAGESCDRLPCHATWQTAPAARRARIEKLDYAKASSMPQPSLSARTDSRIFAAPQETLLQL